MKNEDISVSCPGVSMVNPKASAGLINDEISAKLSQLRALTVSLCDAGFEGFNELNGELKESLLWMVTSSVQEVAVAAD